MFRFAVLVLVFVSCASLADGFGESKPESAQPRAAASRMLIVAHRGLLRHAPENTRAAFDACLNLRFGFELDVQRTRDGKLVCVHDGTLDRTTNATGRVSSKTWAELQTVDAGAWFHADFRGERIPSIDAVFARLARAPHKSILVAVDLKIRHPSVERDLVALAKKHGVLNRLLFIGRTIESEPTRKRFQAADKSAPVAHLANTTAELPAVLADKAADWAYIRFVPTRKQVERIHRAGKRVILVGKTVAGREPANWRAAANAGVDAILTDYPLELREVLRKATR